MPRIEVNDSGIDLLYGKHGPTPKQREARDNPARYKLYGGAVGGGKTVWLCAESLRLCLAYAGNRGFMCRHEATAFRMTTLRTLLNLISEVEQLIGAKIMAYHHKTEKTIKFLNGSEIIYGALGEEQDFERIKSLEIGFFAIDEASETVETNYQMLKSRLRWRLPDGSYPPFFGLLASNPEPGWVKDTFVTPHRMGKPLPDHAFIQALPTDNPHLPPTYIDDLRQSNPEHWVKKYIEGSWDALEGQIWPEFDSNVHVIKPFPIPNEWERFRAIDHGQKNPTCCLWFAVDYDGNVFVYREYYSPGVISKHCMEIAKMSEGEDYYATYLPPECWGKTLEKDGHLWSVADEYLEYGLTPLIKANNEVLAGINRVSEYLRIDPNRVNPITGKKGSPTLFIFETCRNLILEIPNYIWAETNSEINPKERPKKVNDHACDALRYGIISRPSPSKMKKVIPYNSFLETRRRILEAHKRAEMYGKDAIEEYNNLYYLRK